MKSWNRWIPRFFFLILPGLPLWKTVLYGQCIGPFDQIRQMAPWNGPVPNTPWDVLQADGVLQFFPWRDLVFKSWGHLQLPLWNPYELAGTPLLANSQSACFYPFHILLGLLQVPTGPGIVILAWAHLTIAGYGVFRLGKQMGGSNLGAVVGGASFLLSPFMLSWTALSSVITTVAWIPWSLVFLITLSRSRRLDLGPIVGLAGSFCMMLLAGHLQFAAYGVLALGITFVSLLTLEKPFNRVFVGSALAAMVAGGLLAAPQVLPVLSFSKYSNRQNKPSEDGYSQYIASAIEPFELSVLANPLALGNPRESVDEKNPGISNYWPKLVKQGANFAESAISVGPFLLGLFAFVSWRDKRVWPITLLGLFTLLLATGTPLNRILYFWVPGWSASGSPGRVCVLVVLAACALAGSVDLEAVSKKKLIAFAVLTLLGGALSFAGVGLAPAGSPRLAQILSALQSSAAWSSLVCLALGSLLAFFGLAILGFPAAKKVRPILVAVPILLSVIGGGLDLVSTGNLLPPVTAPPNQARVAYLNKDWEIVQAAKANTPPNISSLNQIHELGGYDSLLDADTVKMLNQINGEDSAPHVNGNMMFVKNENLTALRDAGVSYVSHGQDLEPIPNPLGRVSFSGGPVSVQSEDLAQISLRASGSGTLILRDRQMPGWSVTVDGAPGSILPGLWRTVEIKGTGLHTIRFRYDPPGFRSGLALFWAGIVVIALLIGVSRRWKLSQGVIASDEGSMRS